MVVRIDPISPEIDKDTQYILDHLKWASQLGPQRETYPAATEDVLLDITIPPSQDTHSCGLRVLQYHQIIGEAIAQHPTILDGDTRLPTLGRAPSAANGKDRINGTILPSTAHCHTQPSLGDGPQTPANMANKQPDRRQAED